MSTTTSPSPTSLSPRPGTPIHTRSTTTRKYVPRYDGRDSVLSRFGREMRPFIVGPLSADEFLKSFLPPPSETLVSPFKSGMFDGLISELHRHETRSYQVFNKIISQCLQKLVIKCTFNSTDKAPAISPNFNFCLKPDCSVYADCEEIRNKKDSFLDLSLVDFIVEFKSQDEYDPFKDNPCPDGSPLKVLGQLTTYATRILSTQYRTHTFMVFISGDYARLIRWDRSGAVFTRPIYYNKQSHLIDFFIRCDNADREARGHDITVSPASPEDVKLAQLIVPELRGAKRCLDVTISDDHFIIPPPGTPPHIPVGRWTRASSAYDKRRNRRVFLKDSWRVVIEGVKPEGETYFLLHEKQVPNIPSCSLAGDVGNKTYHRTRTDEIVRDEKIELHDRDRWKITSHRHYRLVLDTIGRQLEDFHCTLEFVQAMYAALKAHKAAYDVGILHRDISPGNILIFGKGEREHGVSDGQSESTIEGGMLIDWDLSQIIRQNDKDGSTRRHARTGTWQFIAGDLLVQSNIRHTFAHDLESFFWVLLWIVLTRVKTQYGTEFRSTFIHDTMNAKGGNTKINFLLSPEMFVLDTESKRNSNFQIEGKPALGDLLRELKGTVADRYLGLLKPEESSCSNIDRYAIAGVEGPSKDHRKPLGFLKNHDVVLGLFRVAVESTGWPLDDHAVKQEIALRSSDADAFCSGSKRSRSEVDSQPPDGDQPSSKRSAYSA